MLTKFIDRVSGILKTVVNRTGRGVDMPNYIAGNPDRILRRDINAYHNLSLTPYVYSALRHRDISHLWVSASGTGDESSGEPFSKPQIIYSPFKLNDNAVDEHLEFVRFVFDESFERSFSKVLHSIQKNSLIYGVSIDEIIWDYDDSGRWPGKLVIRDILSRDPLLFEIDPPNKEPGLYVKDSIFSISSYKVPDNKFIITTHNPVFENRYGTSELLPLHSTQFSLDRALRYWVRGLERSGVGMFIGKYGEAFAGKNAEIKRNKFLDAIKKMSSNTVAIMSDKNEVVPLKADIDHDGFEQFVNKSIECISNVITGSPQTLSNNTVGSYAKEESTSVRSYSNLQQLDVQNIQDTFNFHLIPLLLDMNFMDVSVYPVMQIISPELIQPTISKSNAEAIDDLDDGDDDESSERNDTDNSERDSADNPSNKGLSEESEEA